MDAIDNNHHEEKKKKEHQEYQVRIEFNRKRKEEKHDTCEMDIVDIGNTKKENHSEKKKSDRNDNGRKKSQSQPK